MTKNLGVILILLSLIFLFDPSANLVGCPLKIQLKIQLPLPTSAATPRPQAPFFLAWMNNIPGLPASTLPLLQSVLKPEAQVIFLKHKLDYKPLLIKPSRALGFFQSSSQSHDVGPQTKLV